MKTEPGQRPLQLLMYRAMYDNFENPELEAGIVGFRDLKQYVQKLNLKKEDQENVKNLFYNGLHELVNSMLNDSAEILHNPKSKWCKFCEIN